MDQATGEHAPQLKVRLRWSCHTLEATSLKLPQHSFLETTVDVDGRPPTGSRLLFGPQPHRLLPACTAFDTFLLLGRARVTRVGHGDDGDVLPPEGLELCSDALGAEFVVPLAFEIVLVHRGGSDVQLHAEVEAQTQASSQMPQFPGPLPGPGPFQVTVDTHAAPRVRGGGGLKSGRAPRTSFYLSPTSRTFRLKYSMG